MDGFVEGLIWYFVFLFSVTLHEAAHAVAALTCGDDTAARGGQASIDPIPHIRRSPIGMVAMPIVSLVLMGWPLGYASAPLSADWVERNPKDAAWVSFAGPLANFAIMLVCAGLIWLGMAAGVFERPSTAFLDHVVDAPGGGVWEAAGFLLSLTFSLNFLFFLFNLFPVPPLDGVNAVGLVLSEKAALALRRTVSNPAFAMMGLFAAWIFFGGAFRPLFNGALNLLHPGAGYH